jgi:hypothetical protein
MAPAPGSNRHKIEFNMDSERKTTRIRKMAPVWRTLIEVGFIVFLFYSNLLMGQFTVSAPGQNNGLWWAIQNIFTKENFIIALITALIGQLVFEFLRKRI